jgi:DHA1 family inner membrane transport protein
VRHARPALLTLGLGYFAVGVVLTAPVGIVGPVAADLGLAASAVAWLVTAFAVVFALAAPTLQVLGRNLDRRTLLVAGLLALAAGTALTAAGPTLAVVLAGRVLAAVGAAAFGPTALAAGTMLVEPRHQARALGTVFGGISVATVAGVPSVAAAAGWWGWRPALGVVAGLAVLTALLVAALVPVLGPASAARPRDYLTTVRTPGVAAGIATTLAWMAAQFSVYGLASAYLATRFAADRGAVALTLLGFGVAGVLGNLVASRVSDRLGPARVVTTAQVLLAAALAALLVLPAHPLAAAPAFVGWGFASQLFQTPQQGRLVRLEPERRGLVLALNASALYLGISVGSLASGAVYDATGPLWLPIPALVLLAVAALLGRRSGATHTTRPAVVPA